MAFEVDLKCTKFSGTVNEINRYCKRSTTEVIAKSTSLTSSFWGIRRFGKKWKFKVNILFAEAKPFRCFYTSCLPTFLFRFYFSNAYLPPGYLTSLSCFAEIWFALTKLILIYLCCSAANFQLSPHYTRFTWSQLLSFYDNIDPKYV